MRGIGRIVVIILVTAIARSGRVVIIALMTAETVNGNMSALQDEIVVMDRKCCRFPVGVCGMAIDAGRGNVQRDVVRIGGVVVILLVTTHAGIRCVVVISVGVAVVAVGRGVSTC